MNPSDEFRYLNNLVNALSSGKLRLVEDGQDVTQRELGQLSAEVEAIESMLSAQYRQDEDSRNDR